MSEDKKNVVEEEIVPNPVNGVVPNLVNNAVPELASDEEPVEVELTDDEKKEKEREEYVKLLKESKIKFKPVKHDGKVTTNQFGATYKEKRKRKNKATKKSRKANRK